MADGQLLKTSLHDRCVSAGASMGDDGGWNMPAGFTRADDEVARVRSAAGVFDVSNVGRIRIRGDGAVDLLERVCTADVVCQEDDTARLTLLCNDAGGIIDQCLVVRLDDFWLLTTSPSRRIGVLEHLEALAGDFGAKVDDQTLKTTVLCVAGPAAAGLLDSVLPLRVGDMPDGAVRTGSLMLARYIALRSSYMGLWAIEVMLPNMFAGQAWRFITDKAGDKAVAPAGGLARDALRIEAGRCRFGCELDETIDPFTAGLSGAVDLEHDFIGRDALQAIAEKPPARKRVGLVLRATDNKSDAPVTPAKGSPVRRRERVIGAITSAVMSPTLGRIIAMAYVEDGSAAIGDEVAVDIAGREISAEMSELPFVAGD